MSQRTSRVTRSQSAQGVPLTQPSDNPDRPSIARSENTTSITALREQVLQMTTEATEAINSRVSIPGSYEDPDATIQAEPTIVVGEGANPNESTATEADIIHGRSVPRPTVESVTDSDDARLSEDMGHTPEHTEPVQATASTEEAQLSAEPAEEEQANRFWNARISIPSEPIIRRRVPLDPAAGIEDQLDPVPPYAPPPLELGMGRYGPTNIPREERHLYQAHPLSGVRSRIPSQVEAPRAIRPAPTLRQIEAPAPLRIEPRPRNPTPYRSPSSPSSSSSSSSSASEEPENQAPPEEPEGDNARNEQEWNDEEYERLINGPIEDLRRAAAREPALGFFFRVIDDIKDQLLEGITTQLQSQEARQDTEVKTLNTMLQQMTNSITKIESDLSNNRQQTESAAQNAWTAANSAQLGVNEMVKIEKSIDKLSKQMNDIVVAMGAMGKEVAKDLNAQKDALQRLREDTEVLQETLQVIEERTSSTDIMDKDHQWEPVAKSSQAKGPRRQGGLFPGDNPPGPPSEPPSRGQTPHPRTPKKPKQTEGVQDDIPKGARAKKPDAFNGKRGQEAEIFLMKMEIYFNDYGTAFQDSRKMATFLTNMGEGEASKWAKPLLRKILDKEPHEYLANWNSLKSAFLLAFSDPMKKERAIQNIHKLQQTGLAQNYVTSFRTLMQELDWDEHAFIDVFKKGLKHNVQQELLKATITQDTSAFSLEKWMEVAIRIDDLLFTGRNLNSNPNSSQGNRDNRPQNKTTQGKAGRVPLEIIRERRNNGQCLKCGHKGHMIKDCKSKEWYHGKREEHVKGKEAKIEEVKDDKESSDSESEN
ncbi:Retrotransposon-derived protein PEG10 [Ceratobasidium sp. AG-Ba]|nr:Retrotransposon-derived protein PEG10 [Ceratobasidium sp. AG-Ba]QRV88084.1 Retrotransposon-derived protein PEG10 [Ceratobasidium sp. AG-Ba]